MLSSTVTQNSKLYPQAKKGIAIDTFYARVSTG